ncbi:universal stress protein [Microbacterium sp. SLBN-111]|uniref:universal stress protein n=1 Tax=Microbacterium sp. SLBN-111 TaxID=3377733 RepID=UPI003C76973F
MERIVIGVDGSAASRSALAWVAERCGRHPAEVDVIHVSRHPGSGADDPLVVAEQILGDATPGQVVRVHRVDGPVAQTLGEKSADADLLVIGVDPAHPVRAALGGWLPVRVIGRTHAPLCIVPAGWAPRPGHRVTVGWEDDLSSTEALTFAATEALGRDGRLRVVHAWHLPEPAADGAVALLVRPDHVLQEHRELLDAAVQTLERRFPTLHVEAELTRTSAAEALARHSETASMTVIGTHRDGVLAGGYLGSVAQDLLWRTGCPVVVVPSSSFPPRGH